MEIWGKNDPSSHQKQFYAFISSQSCYARDLQNIHGKWIQRKLILVQNLLKPMHRKALQKVGAMCVL